MTKSRFMVTLLAAVLIVVFMLGLFGCDVGNKNNDTYPQNPDIDGGKSDNKDKLGANPMRELRTLAANGALGLSAFADVDDSCLNSELSLSTDTATLNKTLAEQALVLCSGNGEDKTAQYLTKAGFEPSSILHFNYRYNTGDDVRHTAAYSTAYKDVVYGGETRTLIVVAVRGTNGNEWYGNFDFAPSHSDDTAFAENFLFAAQDLYLGVCDAISNVYSVVEMPIANPLFLVCGHSRGGAVANLAALLLNDKFGADNVFAYTFATPNTVRSDDSALGASNIFNFVYDCDFVPQMPLASWGYKRAGTDIALTRGDSDTVQRATVQNVVSVLGQTATGIADYYSSRWSLTTDGKSANGVTPYELMCALTSAVSDGLNNGDTDLDLSSFDDLSANGHYAPLFKLLIGLTQSPDKLLATINYHLPSTYQKLLSAAFAA